MAVVNVHIFGLKPAPTCVFLKCKIVLEILKWKYKERITMHTQKNKHRCRRANKCSDILFSLESLSLNIVCVCACDLSLTKGIREACLKYSVWFPLRPSGEDRSLLETNSVCMNHSVGVYMCVHVYVCDLACLYVSDCVCACPFALLSILSLSPQTFPLSLIIISCLTTTLCPKHHSYATSWKDQTNVIHASQRCRKTPH